MKNSEAVKRAAQDA